MYMMLNGVTRYIEEKIDFNKSVNLQEQDESMMLWLRHYLENNIDFQLASERRCLPPNLFLDFAGKGLFGSYYESFETTQNRKLFDVLNCISEYDLSIASILIIHVVLAQPILRQMDDSIHKMKILNEVRSGLGLCSFALTEEAAGSVPANLESRIQNCGDKQVLNGRKIWVGLSSWAKYFVVFAKNTENVVQACVVEREWRGVTIEHEHKTLGINGIVQATVHFANVEIPDTHLIKALGLKRAKESFEIGRVAFGHIAVGVMNRCINMLSNYISNRTISRGRMSDNPFIQFKLNEIKFKQSVLESYLNSLEEINYVLPKDILGMIAKSCSTEWMWTGLDTTLQLIGGRGCMENNIIARFFRDARVFRIFEGPTEALFSHLGNYFCSQVMDHADLKLYPEKIYELRQRCLQLKKISKSTYFHLQQYLGKIFAHHIVFGPFYGSKSEAAEQHFIDYQLKTLWDEFEYHEKNSFIHPEVVSSPIKIAQYGEDIEIDEYLIK